MQNKNSCTVILNGHGCYSKNEPFLNLSNITYKLTFTCPMNQFISNVAHNYLIHAFSRDISFAWDILNSSSTTRSASNDQKGRAKYTTYPKVYNLNL